MPWRVILWETLSHRVIFLAIRLILPNRCKLYACKMLYVNIFNKHIKGNVYVVESFHIIRESPQTPVMSVIIQCDKELKVYKIHSYKSE